MNKDELREKRNQMIKSLNDIKAILGLDELYIDELEKENAELKDKLEILILVGNTATKGLNDQLTKAKKLLKKVVTDFHNMDCVGVHIDKTIAEAEQFISEVEK